MILNSGAAFAGVQLAETGFDVRSRRRNRPRAGPAKNKQLSCDSLSFNFVVPMAVEHNCETCVSLACFSLQREAWVVCASYRMSHSMGSCLFVIRPRPTLSWKPPCVSRTLGQCQVSAHSKGLLEELQAFSWQGLTSVRM